MRQYSYPGDRKLRGDGSNLSSVLRYLCQEPHLYTELLRFIHSLPEQHIEAIELLHGPRNEVMVQLVETFAGQPHAVDASLLSDGTLRVLAIAAALLSAQSGSLVIIEEIDNGVHPSRAKELLNNIKRIADKRGLCVLLATHNPALLDALPLEAIPDVVCCYRDPEQGDSRLIKLADVPRYSALIAQGTLGSLVTRGLVDRFVKDRTTPQQRKAAAHAWLAQLKAGDQES